jgi:exodeoxyribonuclease III
VNGLRAVLKKGFDDWFIKGKYDIVCLQETKAHKDQIPLEWQNPKNYSTYFAEAEKKGYSGVAIYEHEKHSSSKVSIGLGKEEFDREGRTIIAEYDEFILINAYFPNGQRDLSRVPFKLDFSEYLVKKALSLQKKTGKEILITGDLNTAHSEIDLANPKQNKKSTGFLPEEREWVDKFLSRGFVDVFRHFYPNKTGEYTWWTYRGDCRERNIGWRLDYFFATENFCKKIKKIRHLPKVHGSDHCPVELTLMT